MPLILYRDRKRTMTFIPTEAFGMAARIEHRNVKDVRPYEGPEMWTKTAEVLSEIATAKNPMRIGVESRYLTQSHFASLSKRTPAAEYEDCSDIIEELRMKKDEEELRAIQKGCKITDNVVEDVGETYLRPGLTELDVAGEIIRSSIAHGAEGESFHPQVFSGRRGYLLNISSSKKKIRSGEVVMLDFGVNVDGYRTDTTRCFVLGSPTNLQKKISAVALRITQNAVDRLKPGVQVSKVHKAAIADFKQMGFEGYCRHYTGHGIGLSTWERPAIREYDHTKVEENMTFAVEQGVYLPQFGVRFEENLVITKNGNKSLFKYPAELIQI